MIKRTLLLLLICLSLISGCQKTQRYEIQNAKLEDVSELLKEYIGLNGFQITYRSESEDRASYRVYVGTSVYQVPAEQETSFTQNAARLPLNGSTTPTKYSPRLDTVQGSVRTTSRPAETVETEWSFSIQFTPSGNNLIIYALSSGGFNPGSYVKGFRNFLKYNGYTLTPIP